MCERNIYMNAPTEWENSKERLTQRLTYDLPVLRARLGVSQEELAEKIGISRQTYNAIETGKKEMNRLVFLSLVAVFKNYEKTNQMLKNIDGFEEDLQSILEATNKESK